MKPLTRKHGHGYEPIIAAHRNRIDHRARTSQPPESMPSPTLQLAHGRTHPLLQNGQGCALQGGGRCRCDRAHEDGIVRVHVALRQIDASLAPVLSWRPTVQESMSFVAKQSLIYSQHRFANHRGSTFNPRHALFHGLSRLAHRAAFLKSGTSADTSA